LKISLIVHIVLLAFFTVDAVFFTDEPIAFDQAIRVDMVGLPDKIPAKAPPAPEAKSPKAETPKPEAVAKPEPPKPVAIPKVKDPDAINLQKTKSKEKAALQKLKQMEALEKIKDEMTNESKKKAAAAIAAYKGNELSAGSELTGINKLQADTYLADVNQHMRQYWSLPEYLKHRNLEASVLVRFDQNGNILSKSIAKSSGNPVYDEVVLAAIEKSSPVPPPPAKFVKISTVQGFLFRFSE
jgi:colicin import membrane protein